MLMVQLIPSISINKMSTIPQIFVFRIKMFLFFTLFFLNLYETSAASCVAGQNGCQSCYDATSCLVCQEKFRINYLLYCQPCIGGCGKCYIVSYQCDQGLLGIAPNTAPCLISNCGKCTTNIGTCDICLKNFINSSSTNCIPCTDINCQTCLINGVCTACMDGYYLNLQRCYSCNVVNCKTCSGWGNCTQCYPHYGLVGGQCMACTDIACKKCDGDFSQCTECQLRYGVSNFIYNCQKCSHPKCINCSINSSYCQNCDWQNNLTTMNGKCVPCSNINCISCIINDTCTYCNTFYGVSNGTCILCQDTNCRECARNYTKCTACNTLYGVNSVWKCSLCNMSLSNCEICHRADVDNCLTCPSERILNYYHICQPCPANCKVCFNNSQYQIECRQCIQYFNLYRSACYPVCGDFHIVSDEQCDNQLGRLYDGCTDQCKLQENFTCYDLNKSVCSYNNTVYIQFMELTSKGNQNIFNLKVKIWPPLYIFTVTSQSSLKNLFNLAPSSLVVERVSFNSQFNVLQFEGQITQGISSGQTIYINFKPSEMVDVVEFTATPDQIESITLEKGLTFYLYIDPLNDIVLYLSYILTVLFWVSFILGVVMRKLPGLEAMFVIQITFISLVYSNYSLLQISQRTYPLKYSTGLNLELISEYKNLSRKVTPSPYLQEFKLSEIYLLNNLNINLVLELVLLIALGIVYYRLRRFINQNKEDNKILDKQQLEQSLKEAEVHVDRYQLAWQLMMNAAMFNLAYFFACTSIFFKYGLATHFPSILVFCFQIILLIFTYVKFLIDPSHFDYFRFSFKVTPLAMQHYFFHILNIILIIMFLSLSEQSWAPLIPVTLMLIYTIAYRPYKQTSENIRSALNMTVIMSFLIFRVCIQFVCKCTKEVHMKSTIIRLFYMVNLFELFIVALISILLSVWYFYKDYLLEQEQKNLQIREGEKKQLNRRSFLLQLVRIDPNSKMDNVELDNAFKKMIEPNKSLLNATNDMEKMDNIHQLEVSNERFLEVAKIKKGRIKQRGLKNGQIQFKENKLCEQIKQQNYQDKKKEQQEEMVAEIVKNERIYINLESTMRVVHKIMETEQDLMAVSEYDKIDANFQKRDEKKLNQKLQE